MNDSDLEKHKHSLTTFLEEYDRFLDSSYSQSKTKRNELQRKVTLISTIISTVHGGGGFKMGNDDIWNFYQQLGFTLREGVSKFRYYDQIKSHVKLVINQAIGNIETGMIPDLETKPTLSIKDQELSKRCLDLLNAPGSFDRVINQATLVLEAKLRDKLPFDKLCDLIPETKNQIGENLAHKLLAPPNPAIIVSDKPDECSAFHKMVVGVITYLRNPSHHTLNDDTDWSLAWSVVGIVDSLISEIGNAYVAEDKTKDQQKNTKK
jgi:hypothetical protein